MCTHSGAQNISQLLMFKRFGVPWLRLVLEDLERLLLLKTEGCYSTDGFRMRSWQREAEKPTNWELTQTQAKPHTGTPREHTVRVKTAHQMQREGNRRPAEAPLEIKSPWKHNYLQGICWSRIEHLEQQLLSPAVTFNLPLEVKKKAQLILLVYWATANCGCPC